MMIDLRDWDMRKGTDEPNLLVFSEGDIEEHKDLRLESPVVLDKGYKTAIRFGMFGTPSAVLVNADGKIMSETAVGAPDIWSLIKRMK